MILCSLKLSNNNTTWKNCFPVVHFFGCLFIAQTYSWCALLVAKINSLRKDLCHGLILSLKTHISGNMVGQSRILFLTILANFSPHSSANNKKIPLLSYIQFIAEFLIQFYCVMCHSFCFIDWIEFSLLH